MGFIYNVKIVYKSHSEIYYPRLLDMLIYGTSERYFRTSETCKAAGISKNTFHRWVKDGSFPDVKTRDRRGWRLFTEKEIAKLKAEANRVSRRN